MTKELTLPQRAAVALGTAEHEKDLIALAKQSTDIVVVNNADGRDQAHRVGMTLRNARTAITKAGKAARDDATAFGKAVIAEEKRLVEIIQPEEERVIGLRDAFDAAEQARKDALIAAERARVEKIKTDITAIQNMAIFAVGKPSEVIQASIDILEELAATDERFAEFVMDAATAIADTLDKLVALCNSTKASEAEALRQQQEREAAEAQAKKDREELARQQAQLKKDQEAAAAELQKQRDQIEAERVEAARLAKYEVDRIAAFRLIEDNQRAHELKQAQEKLEAENESLRKQRAELEAQQAALIVSNAKDFIERTDSMPDPEFRAISTCDVLTAPEYRPSPDEIVEVLMEHWDQSREVVIDWLLNANFSEVE